jgi:hypothetical protein
LYTVINILTGTPTTVYNWRDIHFSNVATHVATPTINSKNSRHKTNKTEENKHEENTSEHQRTIPTVSRMRYHLTNSMVDEAAQE